jgi:hypothetical protein
MKQRMTGCANNAGFDKSRWLPQFVITHAEGPIKLEIPYISVRNLMPEIVSIFQIEKMTYKAPDDSSMHDNEKGFLGMCFCQ